MAPELQLRQCAGRLGQLEFELGGAVDPEHRDVAVGGGDPDVVAELHHGPDGVAQDPQVRHRTAGVHVENGQSTIGAATPHPARDKVKRGDGPRAL